MKLLLGIILTLSYSQLFASSSKILFILPFATRSETNIFSTIAKELARKSHQITYVAPSALSNAPASIHQIIPIDSVSDENLTGSDNPIETRKYRKENALSFLMNFDMSWVFDGCHKVYQNEKFQEIYKHSYDLIIISGFMNNCFYGLSHKFNAPFIFISSMPLSGGISTSTGFYQPPSFVPLPYFEFSDIMSFSERLQNTVFDSLFRVLETLGNPMYTEIYRKYLGQDYPEIQKIEANVSLIMSNTHFSLNFPRPNLPDTGIEIGGLHCKRPIPLPKDLEEFVSQSKDGFIYFSLGSVVKGSSMPEKTLKIFNKVFSQLKQNVLWKWETETMPDIPANVKLGKWLPQQDILGHPNLKLFITHGGLLSTQEAAFHGVPLLGFPIFFDQDTNMMQVEKLGLGKKLEISELTEENLKSAIQELLSTPKYANKAKEISTIFQDRPLAPLANAVYWIEYVIRHKGAHHLRSSARDLNYIQYHSIDVISFLLITSATVLFILISILKVLLRKLCSRKIKHSKHSTSLRRKND